MQWLRQLKADTRRLHAILVRESTALRNRELETLLDLTEEKNAVAARINALLAGVPGQAGPLDGGSLTCADLALGGHAEVQTAWAEISRLTVRCRELNETNGATIALLQEYNRQFLEFVLARHREQIGYGADGQVQAETAVRFLGAS